MSATGTYIGDCANKESIIGVSLLHLPRVSYLFVLPFFMLFLNRIPVPSLIRHLCFHLDVILEVYDVKKSHNTLT